MAWKGLKLTADGQNALSAAQAAQRLKIRSIAVGDGSFTGESFELKGMVNQLYEIEELEIALKDAVCMITAELPEKEYEYYFREIGVMVETEEGVKLYAYDNCGEEAQQVIPGTGSATVKRRVRLTLTVANVEEVTVTNPAVMYVTYDDFQEAMGKKVDAEDGKGLSSNDYSDQDKQSVDGLNGLKFGQDEEGNWGYTAPDTTEVVPFGKGGGVETDGRFERIVIGSNNNATFKGGEVFARLPSDFEYKYGQVFVEIVYSLHSAYDGATRGLYSTGMVLIPQNASNFKIQLDGMFLESSMKFLLKRVVTIKNASPNAPLAAGDEIVVSQSFRYDLTTGTFTDSGEGTDDIYLVPKFCFLSINNKTTRFGVEIQ